MTRIALIDDHSLIRNALKELINRFSDFQVCLDVGNGVELQKALQTQPAPDMALVDINMPVMDGFETAQFLSNNYPEVKIIALTVNDDEESVIRMLRAGAVGYLLKDTETEQLQFALQEVQEKGYYHGDLVTNSLMRSVQPKEKNNKRFDFHSREEEFVHFACTELTYKEIADKMCVSPRTIDGYRENLFQRLELRSRVGLVLFAIKNGIVAV